LVHSVLINAYDKAILSNGSLEMGTDDDGAQISITDANRVSNSSRMSLNKLKDQLAQRARTVLIKSPSLTSILTNTSSPNYVEQVYWTEVCIERGKDLSVKDLNGTSDPYVKVVYANEEKYTTSTVIKNLNPIWNEKFTFFTHDLQLPICFQVFDHDRIGRDESMGIAKLDLSRIPLETLYQATLELDNERRSDGKRGSLKINITLTPKPVEFRDEVSHQQESNSYFYVCSRFRFFVL
jgi:Ca2+-dependent lipid-binding protein